MSDNQFCESCGSILTQGSTLCDACGQPVSGNQGKDVSAESWSQLEPDNYPVPKNADRWGSPAPAQKESPARWGSPQTIKEVPVEKVDSFRSSMEQDRKVPDQKKKRRWGWIIVAVLIFLCICLAASAYAIFALFNQ